jgi:hypothetical protein
LLRRREKIRFASPHNKSSYNSWNSHINNVTEQNGQDEVQQLPEMVWTKANKILTEGLKSGTIDGSMKPKQLWESNTEFGKYSLSLFRLALNCNKNNVGFIRDEGELHCMLLS